jgi:hypothetical protein
MTRDLAVDAAELDAAFDVATGEVIPDAPLPADVPPEPGPDPATIPDVPVTPTDPPQEPEQDDDEAKAKRVSSYVILVAVLDEAEAREGAAPLDWQPLERPFEGDSQAAAKVAAIEANPQLQDRGKEGRLWLAAVPVSSWKPSRAVAKTTRVTWSV